MSPSKRDPALISLSHDHHHALVIAMLLKRASDDNAAGTAHAFLDFWRADCEEHFRVEEQELYTVFARERGEDHPVLARAREDHAAIRSSAAELESDDRVDGAWLNALGERLASHVRLEEREMFPLIEQGLAADELEALGERLGQARHPSGDRPSARNEDTR